MADKFLPAPPDDPIVLKLAALREEAELAGNGLLAHLIEIALVEAERLAEMRDERLAEIREGNRS